MDNEKYFLSLSQELSALKDRVRLYLDDAHWLSDGEWKESVIRFILRRHLPNTIGVGRGFVVSDARASTQIDILLYDKTKPILFQDGEFVLVTPDVAKGAIEVKTSINKQELQKTLKKLANIAEFIHEDFLNQPRFFGLFSYEDKTTLSTRDILEILRSSVRGKGKRTIHCISLGASRFIRFWDFHPVNPIRITHKWYAYELIGKAPAYFIHNVIDHLNPEWAKINNKVWYPSRTKEPDKVDEISIEFPERDDSGLN